MATYKPFRELIKPGSNFEFIGRGKLWAMISLLLVSASIGMLFVNKSMRGDYLNWTIDFKGGTEMIFEFLDPDNPEKRVDTVGTGDVRSALQAAGFGGFDVSDYTWENETSAGTVTVRGMMVRTPNFGALADDVAEQLRLAFVERVTSLCIERERATPDFKEADCAVVAAIWSGDRLFARTTKPVFEADAVAFFAEHGHKMRPWADQADVFSRAEEGTGEYNPQFSIEGLDKQFRDALDAGIGGVKSHAVQVYGVGAKAGEQLKADGIKSLFYAMALIVLYLAFRFDIRYCPGAIVALIHDAVLVMGVFAVFWVDVSLTSVAALLTVIGYSVNDTVVIFDRIRENVGRLKDKKLSRIINISLNETLSRTLLTSLTLFVVTIMMNVFGTGLVANFAFAMNVGVVVGVYSSIFVASPVLLFMDQKFYPSKGPVKGEGSKAVAKKSGTRKGSKKSRRA